MLISLLGLPWYIVTVRVERNLSYIFTYSPFFRTISIGTEFAERQWFYRVDTMFLGVLCGVTAILPQIFSRSRRLRIISPLLIIIILLIFASLLPIHVATASRLSLGLGLLLAGSGALLLVFSSWISIIKDGGHKLIDMLTRIPLLYRIILLAEIVYQIINILLY